MKIEILRKDNNFKGLLINKTICNISFDNTILYIPFRYTIKKYNKIYEELLKVNHNIKTIQFKNKIINYCHNYAIDIHVAYDMPSTVIFYFADFLDKNQLALECDFIEDKAEIKQFEETDNPIYKKIALNELINYVKQFKCIGCICYNFCNKDYHLDEYDLMPFIELGFKTEDDKIKVNRRFILELK